MATREVKVEVMPHPDGSGGHAAVVTDRKSDRAWSGEGKSPSEAATQAVRKFLGDRRSREYVG